MKLPVYRLQKGMVTSDGTVLDVTPNYNWGKFYEVEFEGGEVLRFHIYTAVEVTAVPAKHLKRNMEVTGFGMVNTDTVNKEGLVRVGIRNYGVKVYSPDELVPLDPTPATAVLDPKKHLLWAIDNKDWAQARAALTELEQK